MSANFRIALRFLTAKKRSMVMSLSCIILGVGLFVVTQATTSGFEGFFIKTILGTDGALRVEDKRQSTLQSISAGGYGSPFEMQVQDRKYIEGIDYPEGLKETLLTFPNVAAVSEVLHGSNVTIRSSFKDDTVQVFGVRLEDQLRVSDLGNQISDVGWRLAGGGRLFAWGSAGGTDHRILWSVVPRQTVELTDDKRRIGRASGRER